MNLAFESCHGLDVGVPPVGGGDRIAPRLMYSIQGKSPLGLVGLNPNNCMSSHFMGMVEVHDKSLPY